MRKIPENSSTNGFIFLGVDIDDEFFFHGGVMLIRKGTLLERVLHIIEAFLSGRTPEIG